MSTVNERELHSLTDRFEITSLAKIEDDVCLSIYLPTHRAGSETRQDTIRFSNLLKQARELAGSRDDLKAVVELIEEKLGDPNFWRQQGDGLAVLASNRDIYFLRLSEAVEEHVSIDNCFNLKPLVSVAESNTKLYVLALTWDSARLFTEQEDVLELVENESLPTSIEQILLPPDPEEHIQDKSYQAVGNTVSSNTAMFHGQGGGEDQIEGDRRNFIAKLSHIIESQVYQSGGKFVLLATEEVAAAFQAAVDFNVDAVIHASPAPFSDKEISHKFGQQAKELVQAKPEEELADLGNRFGTARNQLLASDQIGEIVPASMQGKVAVLMFDTAAEIRGQIDKEKQTVAVTDREDDIDLVNRAVIAALRTGAQVRCFAREKLPGSDTGVAAIFRF